MRLIGIISLVVLAASINGEIRISLNSDGFIKWTVHNESSSERRWAKVPGGIYSDLNLANDIFHELNYLKYKWVGKENWTYATTFELSQEVLNKLAVNLVFHGIDTVGDVYLNGQLIQSVNNMFVRYVIPIKKVAKAGLNTLEVRLKSPAIAARELAEANGYVTPSCPLYDPFGECHINLLRKMQASFGWSWSPSILSVGIWKSVEIEAFNAAIVRNIATSIRIENNKWIVDIECHCEGATENRGFLYVIRMGLMPKNPKLSNLRKEKPTSFVQKRAASDEPKEATSHYTNFTYKTTLEYLTNQTQAWWPNGYGEQNLWELTCQVRAKNGENDTEEISSLSTVTALRTIELVQEETGNPKNGLSFYFKVNGEPIFVKGANWVPSHILPELASDEKTIRKLLESAKEANMNMLRVTGSGIYESDLFYQIADELGILIWQDMMFSSALYPANKEFLESVALEVDQQVKRLAAHPSVAIWNGNSEIENILATNRFQIENQTQYIQDYITLFVDTIKPIVENRDPSRYYAISSPSNGKKTEEEGHIAKNPNDPLYGDVHYYNYDINPWDMSSYNSGNIISEYGFQSKPSLFTLSKVFKPEIWMFSSVLSTFRQHLRNGYEIMERLIKWNLPLQSNSETEEYYEDFIYYSQIMQAMATKIETEKYRIQRMSGEIKGTMGTLFSQLNDVWQAPTWSSIEYGGRWKMLHYYAAKFFAPVIVVPYLLPDNDTLLIYGVSDLRNDSSCKLLISIYSWNSLVPIHTNKYTMLMRGSSSNLLLELSLTQILNTTQCEKTTCFLHFALEGDKFSAENSLFLSSFSDITNLKPTKMAYSISSVYDKNNKATILLNADRITPFVWLETDEEGTFSDNGFIMMTETKKITFSNKEEGTIINLDKLQKTLRIRSLLPFNRAARLSNRFTAVPLLLMLLILV